MPVSHIGLTVSRLPASCSFFAAILQPLGYQYIGEQNGQIGFGVSEADFFLCQESFGQRSGANHVAFHAPNRHAVDNFFKAALKAGGRIHQEPSTRDPVTGQYSASIIDLDNNAIEVVYRPGEDDVASVVAASTTKTILPDSRSEIARTVISAAPSGNRAPLRSIVNAPASIAPTLSSERAPEPALAETKAKDNTLKTLGTLCLGAAAGVAFAYAISRAEEQDEEARNVRETAAATPPPAPLREASVREPSIRAPSIRESSVRASSVREISPDRDFVSDYRYIEAAPSSARSRMTMTPRSVTSPAYLGPSVESYISAEPSRYSPRTARPLAIEDAPRSSARSLFAIEAPPQDSDARTVISAAPSSRHTAVSSSSNRHRRASSTAKSIASSRRHRSTSRESRRSTRSHHSHHSHKSSKAPSAIYSTHSKKSDAPPSAANFPLPRSLASYTHSASPSNHSHSHSKSPTLISASPPPVTNPRSTTSSSRTITPANFPLPHSSSGTSTHSSNPKSFTAPSTIFKDFKSSISHRSLRPSDVPLPRSVVSSTGSVRASAVPLPDSVISGRNSNISSRTVVPADIPLPPSGRTSVVTAFRKKMNRRGGAGSEAGTWNGEVDLDDLESVAPEDSVSQVSSRRSRKSGKSGRKGE